MMKSLRHLVLGLTVVAAPVLAEDLKTEWIEPVEGYEESGMGAQLRNIETEGEDTRVTIGIPKSSLANTDDIEEVVVVGKQPDKREFNLDIEHEWVSDYEKDYYGLVLYLGKDGNIPLRLHLKGQEGP